MSHDDEPATRAPSRGAMVTYVCGEHAAGRHRLRIAKVVGPVAVDPTTDSTWIGVRHPDTGRTLDLIAGSSIVDISPPC
ncbi:hypothetical protein [Actinophytocola sp.]|uniref:hypothetical protein n=1 Tax=Actinophytocola sp. TaxID=1872138 RepID=UPI003D6AAF17